MLFMLHPYHLLLAVLIGWANECQRQIIEFQNDQIEALAILATPSAVNGSVAC
jgi:hypothetical protein